MPYHSPEKLCLMIEEYLATGDQRMLERCAEYAIPIVKMWCHRYVAQHHNNADIWIEALGEVVRAIDRIPNASDHGYVIKFLRLAARGGCTHSLESLNRSWSEHVPIDKPVAEQPSRTLPPGNDDYDLEDLYLDYPELLEYREYLNLKARGLSVQEIARILGVSGTYVYRTLAEARSKISRSKISRSKISRS